MIVGAVPSGGVGNIAPRCWEGRKEKVLAGVRGWWAGGMEVSVQTFCSFQ